MNPHRTLASLWKALAVWLCLAGMFNAFAQTPRPPVEAFFHEPLFSQAQLSPDGNKVAFLVGARNARTRLAVLDLQTLKPSVVGAFDNADVQNIAWVNDQRLVFRRSVELVGPGYVDEGRGLFAVNTDGSNSRQLVESVRVWAQSATAEQLLPWDTFIVDVPGRATGNHIYVARAQESSREKVDYFLLQRLNTVNGRAEELEVPPHSVRWAVDPSGEVRAALTQVKGRSAMHLRVGNSWKQIAEFDSLSGGGPTPSWVGPDGTLYVSAPLGDKAALYTMDTGTGKLSAKPVAASRDFDIYPHFVANDKQLLGLRYTVDAEVTQWLTPEMTALQALIDKRLPATANRISVPKHGDSPWVLVQAWADVQPPVSYVYNRSTDKLTLLGSSHPGIRAKEMGQTDLVRLPARDGRSIPAWLTLPAGGGKKLPMVVLLHGGPWARGMRWEWDAEVQFLASRGYAVLQPEFRGSSGYGFEHMEAGFRQWGAAMQTDVADATRWAIAQGHADPARICVAGASYGGYATLMGLAQNPELFRCGISWVGVTDIQLLFSRSWSDINAEAKRYGLARMVGDPDKDAAMLSAASPLANAARIKQPLLLAYGAWDTRVPLVHGERFRDAVRPHNQQVEWVVYPKEGHGWAKLETRLDFWGRVERFLAANMGPQPTPN